MLFLRSLSCLLTFLFILSFSPLARAADICILTGLDISNSLFNNNQIRPTLTSLAKVLGHVELQNALTSGPQGSAKFGLYLWGGHALPMMGPFVEVRRPEPANGMGKVIRTLLQLVANIDDGKMSGDGSTSTIRAIDAGLHRFPPDAECNKKVLNIVTDDDDSRADEMAFLPYMQETAALKNIRVNLLIIGDPDGFNRHFHKLKMGPGSFTMGAKAHRMEDAWFAKFSADVSGLPPPRLAYR